MTNPNQAPATAGSTPTAEQIEWARETAFELGFIAETDSSSNIIASRLAAREARAEKGAGVLTKIADWMERQAARDEWQAKNTRFESLREAYAADAKNYRAMAKEARAALSTQADGGE